MSGWPLNPIDPITAGDLRAHCLAHTGTDTEITVWGNGQSNWDMHGASTWGSVALPSGANLWDRNQGASGQIMASYSATSPGLTPWLIDTLLDRGFTTVNVIDISITGTDIQAWVKYPSSRLMDAVNQTQTLGWPLPMLHCWWHGTNNAATNGTPADKSTYYDRDLRRVLKITRRFSPQCRVAIFGLIGSDGVYDAVDASPMEFASKIRGVQRAVAADHPGVEYIDVRDAAPLDDPRVHMDKDDADNGAVWALDKMLIQMGAEAAP